MSDAVDYTQTEFPVPTPKYSVFHKVAWGDDWEASATVDLLSIEDGAGTIARIELDFAAGDLLREETTTFAAETPLEWMGRFVMVEWYGQDPDGTPNDDVIERWIGRAMLEEQAFLGASDNITAAIDQKILVRGLEHLLDEIIVTGSWIGSKTLDGSGGGDDENPIAVRIDTPMVFNAPRNGPVPWDRNSSDAVVSQWYAPGEETASDVPQNHEDGSGPSVFAEIGNATTTWKIGDVLDYLVCLYSPDLGDGVRFRTATVEPLLSGEAGGEDDALGDALYEIVAPPMRVEGQTLFSCLNQLLRPERGLGWRLVYDEPTKGGTSGPIIHVFSIQAEEVTVAEVAFPAASGVVTIDLSERHDASWQSRRDLADEFGKLVVRGAELLTCFSVSKADGSLAKGWTPEEEAKYITPPDIGDEGDEGYSRLRDR